jgi:hypothetical protein
MKRDLKIISARITKMPTSLFSPMPNIFVTLEDKTEILLFEYYPDEIEFRTSEFIGLKVSEALRLKTKKDKEFLTDYYSNLKHKH